MRPCISQNWVVNLVNLTHFGSPTFPLVILVLYHQLGLFFRLSSYIFLYFFLRSKVVNNNVCVCKRERESERERERERLMLGLVVCVELAKLWLTHPFFFLSLDM